MKIATVIARILLGLVFVVLGLNGFMHFIPAPPPPTDTPAGQFIAVVTGTGFMNPICALQVIGGLLVLLGIFVPLGLTILAPIIFNILLFHICMAPGPKEMMPGAIVTVLEVFLIWRYWANFRGLVQR